MTEAELEDWIKATSTEAAAAFRRVLAENSSLRRWKALNKPVSAAMEIANSHLAPLQAEIGRLRAREKLLESVVERQALGLMKIRTMQGDPVQIARDAMDGSLGQRSREEKS